MLRRWVGGHARFAIEVGSEIGWIPIHWDKLSVPQHSNFLHNFQGSSYPRAAHNPRPLCLSPPFASVTNSSEYFTMGGIVISSAYPRRSIFALKSPIGLRRRGFLSSEILAHMVGTNMRGQWMNTCSDVLLWIRMKTSDICGHGGCLVSMGKPPLGKPRVSCALRTE